ncbi:MAG: DNA alkylation repair protein [Streptococcaceae bacterium]|jgi:3-methyladenine DNA glycosylase AlkD|nr:DNA alkylation repair protein [Streptococcaceae bacterium]
MEIEKLKEIFIAHEDAEQAHKMSEYLLGKFPHFGIQTPLRRELTKDFFKEEVAKKRIDWELVEKLWDLPEREFHHVASDLLIKMKKYLTVNDLVKIKLLAERNTWWDSVDALTASFRHLTPDNSAVKKVMLSWSTDKNFWIRRMAITSQNLAKDKTDRELLAQIIENNFGSDEFFINKAIGWVLRDYSKTNADWVREFIFEHENIMDSLSRREASKYL